MINKSVDEAVFDAILAQAFRDAAEADMKEEALDKDFVPVKLTPEHLRIEQRAYRRYEAKRKQENNANLYAGIRRAVASILIVGTIGFATVFAVPPVRAAVVDAVVEFFEKYISFDFWGDSPNVTMKLGDYELSYIPNGFELTEQEETRLYNRYNFINPETGDSFSIKFSATKSLTVQFDSEYSTYDSTDIGDYTAYWIESEINTNHELMINNGTDVIEIAGNVSQQEILTIAKNIS